MRRPPCRISTVCVVMRSVASLRLDDMLRNQWTACAGSAGRLRPESLDDITGICTVSDRGTPEISRPLSERSIGVIPSAADLKGRRLTIIPEFRNSNPRRPWTHGWLAFEVLRRAPGGSLSFSAYAKQLFEPDLEIRNMAESIPGQLNAYQQFKHIRCDIFRHVVLVDPPLPDEWYGIQRCSGGSQPHQP
jgi:hypothetical protein